jgi:hypothetical protein
MKTDEPTGVADARAQSALTQRVGQRLLPRAPKKRWWHSIGRGRGAAKS